jgi:hypothetical protein
MRVLYFLKTNPTLQHFRVDTRAKEKRVIWKLVWRHIAFLAKRVEHDAESLWARRNEINGPLPQYIREMFGDVVFLVDSFPIVILRAGSSLWRLATYQGKYKQFIMKAQVCVALCLTRVQVWLFLQVICSLTGVPLCVPRLHCGAVSDIDIFRSDKPELGPSELGLGDKAYFGDEDVEPPYKKPAHGDLTDEQIASNILHA